MELAEIIDGLVSLAQLDIDAIHAYDQAIEKIDMQVIREQLSEFKADHSRHIINLSEAIERMGGTPPEFSRDFKGFIIQGMTALKSVTGTEGALKAMKMNEKLTNASYDRALTWDLPPDVKQVVQQNREDERRHLQYIDRALDTRLWDRKQQVA